MACLRLASFNGLMGLRGGLSTYYWQDILHVSKIKKSNNSKQKQQQQKYKKNELYSRKLHRSIRQEQFFLTF